MPSASSKTYEWSSPLTSWHERARSHPAPNIIDFNKANILMASHFNAMGGDGFNMALFELEDKQTVAVDGDGQVVVLKDTDAAAFSALMEKTTALQERDYRIQYEISCQPFTLVAVAISADTFARFSIFGYSKKMRVLENNAGQLPENLWELYGLVEEGTDHGQDHEKDEGVLKAVKERVNTYNQSSLFS